MMHKTSCSDLSSAMFILAQEIESEDGIANAAIHEAGERIQELSGQNDVLRGLLDAYLAITLKLTNEDLDLCYEACGSLKDLQKKTESALAAQGDLL